MSGVPTISKLKYIRQITTSFGREDLYLVTLSNGSSFTRWFIEYGEQPKVGSPEPKRLRV